MIGDIINGLGSLVNAGTGIAQTVIGANQSNQNLDFQKEQFAYQKELNKQYLDRMDNRLQYMVKDAKASGINPLSAIGQSGGYSPQQSAQAPQQDSSYLNFLDKIGNSINQSLVNSKLIADSKVSLAQANQLDAQTINTTTDTDLKKQMKANLKHNLDIANKLNAPVGILPDIKRDLYHELKDLLKDFHKPGDKKYETGEHWMNYPNVDAFLEKSIDKALGDSFLNKGRKWLGKKIQEFNEFMNN